MQHRVTIYKSVEKEPNRFYRKRLGVLVVDDPKEALAFVEQYSTSLYSAEYKVRVHTMGQSLDIDPQFLGDVIADLKATVKEFDKLTGLHAVRVARDE